MREAAIIATLMQSVPIEKDLTIALAIVDIQAMVLTAQVPNIVLRIYKIDSTSAFNLNF